MTKHSKRSSGRKSRKRKYHSLFLGIGIGTAIVFSILVIVFVLLLNRGTPREDDVVISEEIPPQEEIEPEPSKPEEIPEENAITYPMPEYNFLLEEIYVPIEGLNKEYTLAWVSDLHLIPKEDSNISPSAKLKTRYDNLSVTDEGIHAEELWPEVVKCLNYGDYDAVIFGGDMMDYCSEDNMELFRKGYNDLRYDKDQILYIRADHDYGAWYVGDQFTQRDIYHLHEELDGDDPEQKYLDMEEFILIGINNSTKNITDENFSIVESQYEKAAKENKPVIAVTHVPYGSNVDDSLKELSMKVRNKPYYWVGPDYQPNDTMWDYLNFIFQEDTQVKQVLAGHLHAPWDGQITDQLREHIFSPAFSGVIGVIHIVPAGQEKENTSRRLRPEEEMPSEKDTEEKSETDSQTNDSGDSPSKATDTGNSKPAQTPAKTPSADTSPSAGGETPPAAGENPPSTNPVTPPADGTQGTDPNAVPPAATDTQPVDPNTGTPPAGTQAADPNAAPPATDAPPSVVPPATDAQVPAPNAAQ